jgi:hypothetical protein
MVLEWCDSGVTFFSCRFCHTEAAPRNSVVLQWCYSGAIVVLQWCSSGVYLVVCSTI